jgi:hypothetical protein
LRLWRRTGLLGRLGKIKVSGFVLWRADYDSSAELPGKTVRVGRGGL